MTTKHFVCNGSKQVAQPYRLLAHRFPNVRRQIYARHRGLDRMPRRPQRALARPTS